MGETWEKIIFRRAMESAGVPEYEIERIESLPASEQTPAALKDRVNGDIITKVLAHVQEYTKLAQGLMR